MRGDEHSEMQHVGAMRQPTAAYINTKEGRAASMDEWLKSYWCGKCSFKEILK